MNFEDLIYLFETGVESRGIMRVDLDEAALLYKYVQKSQGNIVEIGRKYGGSALFLASASDDDQKVFSIDIVNYPQLEDNLRKAPQNVVDKISIIVGDSGAVEWNEPIGLLFVDGDHAFESVKKDSDKWCPHVVPGGFAAFHDVRDTHLGLEPILDAMKESGEWEETDCVDTLVVMRKCEREL